MFLITKNSNSPQRLRDVHNLIQSLDYYFLKMAPRSSFIGMIESLEDHKGMLIVVVKREKYKDLSSYEKDYFSERLENVWKLYHEENLKIVDIDGREIYKSWEKSPRAR